MKTLQILLSFLIPVLLTSQAIAGPPGFGKGKGHGPMEGGDFRGVIHELFAAHEDIDRNVELTESGYRATTTSAKPETAKLLQKHVAQMEARLDGGFGVRNWDPAFAELREHYEDIEVKLTNIDGGVAVTVAGKTPAAVKVAQNHAKIVSGFVEKGHAEAQKEHSRALK